MILELPSSLSNTGVHQHREMKDLPLEKQKSICSLFFFNSNNITTLNLDSTFKKYSHVLSPFTLTINLLSTLKDIINLI